MEITLSPREPVTSNYMNRLLCSVRRINDIDLENLRMTFLEHIAQGATETSLFELTPFLNAREIYALYPYVRIMKVNNKLAVKKAVELKPLIDKGLNKIKNYHQAQKVPILSDLSLEDPFLVESLEDRLALFEHIRPDVWDEYVHKLALPAFDCLKRHEVEEMSQDEFLLKPAFYVRGKSKLGIPDYRFSANKAFQAVAIHDYVIAHEGLKMRLATQLTLDFPRHISADSPISHSIPLDMLRKLFLNPGDNIMLYTPYLEHCAQAIAETENAKSFTSLAQHLSPLEWMSFLADCHIEKSYNASWNDIVRLPLAQIANHCSSSPYSRFHRAMLLHQVRRMDSAFWYASDPHQDMTLAQKLSLCDEHSIKEGLLKPMKIFSNKTNAGSKICIVESRFPMHSIRDNSWLSRRAQNDALKVYAKYVNQLYMLGTGQPRTSDI